MLRRITIEPCLNGFIVNVGCQTLAYTGIDKLVFDLKQYLCKPEETEKRLIEEEGINKQHTLPETQGLTNQINQACDLCTPLSTPTCH